MNEEMELPENAMPEQPMAQLPLTDNVIETTNPLAEVQETIENNVEQVVNEAQESLVDEPTEVVAEISTENGIEVETIETQATQAVVAEVSVPEIQEIPVVEIIAENQVVTDEVTPIQASYDVAPVAVSEISTVAEATQAEEEITEQISVADYSGLSKNDLLDLLSQQLALIKAENVQMGAFKKVDAVLKEIKPIFDQQRNADKAAALEQYLAENESEEGFAYKADAQSQQFDALYKQIKETKNIYFKDIEKSKEKNFGVKTELLNRLREVVEGAESSPVANKASLEALKKIQDEWKAAGNVASANNNALWDTFHALTDRFYSNRSIYFELLDLDRKKNLSAKIEVCERLEKLLAEVQNVTISGEVLDRANAMFEEFRGIGPATRETQEALWQRFKESLDVIYAKRRQQLEGQKAEAEENYKLKAEIAELTVPFVTFNSTMITDWNDRSKAIMALQDQWNNQKGSMPREKGKVLADTFWGNIKAFYKNKTAFFDNLEAQRAANLQIKVNLCEEVENLVAAGDDSAANTNRVIQLQKDWKTAGFVPEKQRESIYARFKKACDEFFDMKRLKSADTEKSYEDNFLKKVALCEQIEAETKAGNADLSKLNAYKAEFNAIGFVPRKNLQDILKRFNAAINGYIGGMGKVSLSEKEKMRQENSEESGSSRNTRTPVVKEGEAQRKIQNLENEIATWKNNIEFFAKSKTTEKLRADFEKKIERAEAEVKGLKEQLKSAKA